MPNTKRMIPCFLCGNGVEVKIDKRGKPYFMCNPCGVQAFVRCKPGIELLNKQLMLLKGSNLIRSGNDGIALEVQGLLNRRTQLRAQLQRIEDEWDWSLFFKNDPAQDSAVQILKREIGRTEKRLSELAKAK